MREEREGERRERGERGDRVGVDWEGGQESESGEGG